MALLCPVGSYITSRFGFGCPTSVRKRVSSTISFDRIGWYLSEALSRTRKASNQDCIRDVVGCHRWLSTRHSLHELMCQTVNNISTKLLQRYLPDKFKLINFTRSHHGRCRCSLTSPDEPLTECKTLQLKPQQAIFDSAAEIVQTDCGVKRMKSPPSPGIIKHLIVHHTLRRQWGEQVEY
jgi:hypothetical protein